jgi:hypothetical protein
VSITGHLRGSVESICRSRETPEREIQEIASAVAADGRGFLEHVADILPNLPNFHLLVWIRMQQVNG